MTDSVRKIIADAEREYRLFDACGVSGPRVNVSVAEATREPWFVQRRPDAVDLATLLQPGAGRDGLEQWFDVLRTEAWRGATPGAEAHSPLQCFEGAAFLLNLAQPVHTILHALGAITRSHEEAPQNAIVSDWWYVSVVLTADGVAALRCHAVGEEETVIWERDGARFVVMGRRSD